MNADDIQDRNDPDAEDDVLGQGGHGFARADVEMAAREQAFGNQPTQPAGENEQRHQSDQRRQQRSQRERIAAQAEEAHIQRVARESGNVAQKSPSWNATRKDALSAPSSL